MDPNDDRPECEKKSFCMSRRDFLKVGATGAVTVFLTALPGVLQAGEKPALRVVGYPRKKIGTLIELKQDQPLEFRYPQDHFNCASFLVKLGQEAAGGIGPEKDVVAFNSLCTHLGGGLAGLYQAGYKAIGPCPVHLSVFDLRRHGMVVSGHATETLPQVILELAEGDIYATGVMGLIYGFSDNKISS